MLVIKATKKPQRVVGKTTNVWDKVASAASVAKNTSTRTNGVSSNNSSRPSSAQNSARSSPQSSRPASPGITFRTASSTAWGGASEGSGSTTPKKGKENFPKLKGHAFPSLPIAAPKHEMIMNMRRTASGSKINSAWGSNPSSNQDSEVDSSADDSGSTGNSKKKKGRQNKVLFRVGL